MEIFHFIIFKFEQNFDWVFLFLLIILMYFFISMHFFKLSIFFHDWYFDVPSFPSELGTKSD